MLRIHARHYAQHRRPRLRRGSLRAGVLHGAVDHAVRRHHAHGTLPRCVPSGGHLGQVARGHRHASIYEADPNRGFYGGGGIDARATIGPLFWAALDNPFPGMPTWGSAFKEQLANFRYTMSATGHGTSLPQESNTVTLDPDLVDAWGRPGICLTYMDHPDDLAFGTFLQDRSVEILEAAGAERIWRLPVTPSTVTAHLLGTCRMGNDPDSSVVDRYHRAHDVPNLFICDGSSMVTSGRGQPTMTIQALAYRAADHITESAQRGEI